MPTKILKHQIIFIQMTIVLGPIKMKKKTTTPTSVKISGQISPVHIEVVI